MPGVMPDHFALVAAVRAAVPSSPDWCLFRRWTWELTCMPKSEWASWVQAVGSVTAIIVGAAAIWWQVGRQHRLHLDVQRVEEVRKLRLIGGNILTARVASAELRDTNGKGLQGASEFADLKARIATLSLIQPLDYPEAHAAMAVATLVECFRTCEMFLDPAHLSGTILTAKREKYLNSLDPSLEFAESMIYQCLVDRRADLHRWTWTLTNKESIRPKPPIPAKPAKRWLLRAAKVTV